MKPKTIAALEKLAYSVSWLAQGTVHMIGQETAKDVMLAADELLKALKEEREESK